EDLAIIASAAPKGLQALSQPHDGVRVAMFERPVQRREEIVIFPLQPVKPYFSLAFVKLRLNLLGQHKVPIPMPVPNFVRFSGLLKSATGILSHRLEQAVAALTVPLVKHNERLVHKVRQ